MESIRLLIADDHIIIRNGLKLMLNKNPKYKIVAEVSSGQEAIDYIDNNPNDIDVILMDIDMSGVNGIDATRIITNKYSNIKILALSMHDEEVYITSMIDAGATGYILKQADIYEITQAIENIALGKKFYSHEVSITIINSLHKKCKDKGNELSVREMEILSLIAAGLTNKEAGEKLFISARTVESHRRNILDKLDFKNTAEMIRYAIEHNLTN
ncbi:MAG: response regulator transcription factor [Bacteroidetes bacterium]|nr:response regulator transcription factor [Bacteroidota bacterium]